MRTTCRTLMVGLLASTAISVTGPTAAAYEVVTEASGVHCSAITENDAPTSPEVAGGCPVRGTGNDIEFGGPFGAMVVCDINTEGKVNESGAGIGTWSVNGCESGAAAPCTGAADAHSTGNPTSAGTFPGTFVVSFCLNAFGLTNRCANLSGTADELAGHTYRGTFTHTNKCSNGVNSVAGVIDCIIDAAHPKLESR